MRRAPVAALLVALLSAGLLARQRQAPTTDIDFVEIDAVVVDKRDQPVHGLQASDFTVKEDGQPVTVTTFREVTGPVPGDRDSARTVVLLLDDAGVLPTGTQTLQIVARGFVERAAPLDEMPVIRLHTEADDPYGDRLTAESRIDAFRAGVQPFAFWSTTRELLDRVTQIAKVVAGNAGKRKIIVCIGSPFLCHVNEPPSTALHSFETAWFDAIHAAAAGNVSYYALTPAQASVRSGGLADATGGEVFAPTSDVGPAIDRILRDAGNYYVLGYWPAGQPRDVHRVEVKVRQKGARVHARRLR